MKASIACAFLLSMVLKSDGAALGHNRYLYGQQAPTLSTEPTSSTPDPGTYSTAYTDDSQNVSRARQPGPLPESLNRTEEDSFGQRFNSGIIEHQGKMNGSSGQGPSSERLQGGSQVGFLDKVSGRPLQNSPSDQGTTTGPYLENGGLYEGHQNKLLSQGLTDAHRGHEGDLYGRFQAKPSGNLPQNGLINQGSSSLGYWGNRVYQNTVSGRLQQQSPLGLATGAYQGQGVSQTSEHQYGPRGLTSGAYAGGLFGGLTGKLSVANPVQYGPLSLGLTLGGYQGHSGGLQEKPSGNLLQYVPITYVLTSVGSETYSGGLYRRYQAQMSGLLPQYVPLSYGSSSVGYGSPRGGVYGGYQDQLSGSLQQSGGLDQGPPSAAYGGYQRHYSPLDQGLKTENYWGKNSGLQEGTEQEFSEHSKQYNPLEQSVTLGQDGRNGGLQTRNPKDLLQNGPLDQAVTSGRYWGTGGFQDKLSGPRQHSGPLDQELESGEEGGGFQSNSSGHLQQPPPLEQGLMSGELRRGYLDSFPGRMQQHNQSHPNSTTGGYWGNIGVLQDKLPGHQQTVTPSSQGMMTQGDDRQGDLQGKHSRHLQQTGPLDGGMRSGGCWGKASQEKSLGYLQHLYPSEKTPVTNEDQGYETKDMELSY